MFSATWLSYAAYYFCRKPFYIAKSTMERELSWDAEMLGQIGAVYLVAYALGQFVAGAAGSRWGPRILVLVGSMVSIAASVGFGLTNSFGLFLVFMGINGLAQATGWPGNVAAMAPWFSRKQRGTVMGFWATNYQVGGVLANAMAAFVLAKTEGLFRYSFLTGAVVLLVVWGYFVFAQRNRPEDVGLPPLELEDAAAESGDRERWSRAVWTNVLVVGAFYFFVKFIRYSLWSWAPYLLDRFYGLSAADAGYLSTVFDVTGVFGVIACGVLSDRVFGGRRAKVSFYFVLCMFASCVLLYTLGATSILLFTVSIGLIGFFLYGPDALMSGAGAIEAGSVRSAAKAAGIINGMGSMGSVFQELILGRFLKEGGLGATFAALVASSLLAALLLGVLLWRNRRGQSDL